MSDNTEKSNRGRSGQENLKDIIESLQAKDYIVSYETDYRDGYKGFDPKQFFFQYLIEYENKEIWILHSTTSIRSDRMNIQQWNAEHLKRLNGYIKKAYVVYPNGLSDQELRNAKNYQDKLEEGIQYSAVDGVVSQSEMYSIVERYALELLGSKGKALAKRGNNFESWVTEILNSTENFLKWKNNDPIKTGFVYDIFIRLVENMDLKKQDVVSINATNDVPRLPSGGKAKTDILVTVDTFDGEYTFTYSCKKTGSDWVSAHEYSADQFVDTLGIDDPGLVVALNDFQTCGTIEKLPKPSYEALSRRLSAYNEKLNKWVLGGIGGQGDPETQWAHNIITYNENTASFKIESIDDYVESLERKGMTGNFGTLFRWTYPSGGLGKRIQLKMKVE
ncbi:MAG: MspI family type II restriction endonuclease [Acetatifactor sp.]|nr:MspI family type II restriction endonuclease [Acetatifactor sp.]